MYSSSLITTPAGQFSLSQTLLGQGSFGAVYMGHCLANNKQVAIKLASLDHVQTAIQQAFILKKLNFPQQNQELWNLQESREGVLKYFGTFRTYNLFYIVTQYFGKSLSKIIEDLQPFNFQQGFKIFQAILKALKPLRQQKILHRDIKPDNILIQYNKLQGKYQAKMCDFGLSIVEKSGKFSSIQFDRAGTITYESPEVIKFKEYSQKSQIWSLGVVLYMLIYKKLPYNKEVYLHSETLYEAIMTDNIKFYGIPKPIEKLLQKSLNNSINKRIDFNSLQKQVESLIQRLPQILQQQKKNIEYTQKQRVKKIKAQQEKKSTSAGHPSTSNSNLSACSKDNSIGNKQMEESPQTYDPSVNKKFVQLLIKTYQQLKTRINTRKIQKKQIVISLLNICQNFTNQQSNKECVNYFSSQVIKLLRQNIQRMKVICQYAQQQKQISFNLQQFMMMDTLLILYQITKKRIQDSIISKDSLTKFMEKLEENLQFEGKAKSMQYYKQLRNRMNNFT